MLIFFVHENVLTITISARDKITFYSSIVSYLFIVPFYANHNVTIDWFFNAVYSFYFLHLNYFKISRPNSILNISSLLNENE